MPLSPVTKVFGVKDCKLSAITADPAGGSPTFGTSVDVPGIKSVAITGSINNKELRGDNTLLDSDSAIGGVDVSIEYAKLSQDVLKVLLGGTIAASGTTPNQISTWGLTNASKPAPFKLEAQAVSADSISGDVHFVLWKVILSEFPEMGLAEEDYKTFTVKGKAMPLLSNGKWLDTVLNETAVAIV